MDMTQCRGADVLPVLYAVLLVGQTREMSTFPSGQTGGDF